ncbi:hypothetical protein E2K98_22075 [Bacillus salipaludis]|uniref:Uncharacterized protein n=1 Tax=Bacillus salipaludis TaxID=2547811 RepID=A0A4R5VLH6_9BACI|nr:hypothetical protein [Bacillus salipaludis]TDK58898.1 hypothetical protein E2K98_22075 [Bacillus salipaludis]
MSLKDLFFIFNKNDDEKDLKRRLTSLELDIKELKKSLLAIQEQEKVTQEKIIHHKEPPIIIEKINIEKIILDKYELNNNFGQLGIKELKGKLNIGATYGSEYTPNLNEDEEKVEEEPARKEKIYNQTNGFGPKVNINAKKEEDMKKD